MAFLFNLGKQSVDERQPVFNLRAWVLDQFLRPRMNTSAGYAVLIAAAMVVSAMIGRGGWPTAVMLTVAIVVVPLLLATLLQVRLGLYLIVALGFLVPFLKRLDHTMPYTLLIDATLGMMVLGVFIKQIYPRDWSFARTPVLLAVAVWLGYCLFQLVNPSLSSGLAWLYSVRSLGGYWLLVLVGLFALQREKTIRGWLHFLLGASTLVALYGLWQYSNGFQLFELSWLYRNPEQFRDVIGESSFRIFSVLTTPGAFGITMAIGSILALSFAVEKRRTTIERALFWGATWLMLTGVLLSGSRTAFVMVPVGYSFLILLTWQREVALVGLGLGMLWLALMVAPIESPLIKRVQYTFDSAKGVLLPQGGDNQDFVQPYIQSHPVGSGIGSTGEGGQLFSPHTLLSQFPPNSGFVQVAVETGWIGLLLYTSSLLLMLWVAVKVSLRLPKGSREQSLAAALTSLLVMLVVAHYPQKALLNLPTTLIFPLAVAAVVNLGRMKR